MLFRIFLCSWDFSPTNVERLKPTDDHDGSPMHGRRTEGVWDVSKRSIPKPAPTLLHKNPLDVLASYCSRCSPFIRRRHSRRCGYGIGCVRPLIVLELWFATLYYVHY